MTERIPAPPGENWLFTADEMEEWERNAAADIPQIPAGAVDADRHLSRICQLQQDMMAKKAHADQLRANIDAWLEYELLKMSNRANWHRRNIEGFMIGVKEKTLTLVNGVIRRISGQERIAMINTAEFLTWAVDNDKQDLVLVVRKPSKKAIMQHIKKTGEIPPGCEIEKGWDSISITTVQGRLGSDTEEEE